MEGSGDERISGMKELSVQCVSPGARKRERAIVPKNLECWSSAPAVVASRLVPGTRSQCRAFTPGPRFSALRVERGDWSKR